MIRPMDIGNEAYLGLAKQILEETSLAFLHKSDLHTHPAYNIYFQLISPLNVIVIDDQQDATILACLFIPNQLYMFQAMSLPIIRST